MSVTNFRVQWATDIGFTQNVGSTIVGNVTSHTVTGLNPSTQYYLRVAARDAQGNEGAVSDAVTSTTEAVVSSVWPTLSPAYLPIIPGAAGYGMNSTFGTGRSDSVAGSSANAGVKPKVFFVDRLHEGATGQGGSSFGSTNGLLTADGVGFGSLRWCVSPSYDGGYANEAVTGPRIVIPLVSGVIVGAGVRMLVEPGTSIHFECAPAPGLYTFGIAWAGAGTNGLGGNTLYSHIGAFHSYGANQSLFNHAHWSGMDFRDVVYSNCSGIWACDETFSAWSIASAPIQQTNNFTYWRCLAAMGIGEITPGDVNYGKTGHGLLVHVHNYNISVLRSVFLHGYQRNPRSSSPGMTMADSLVYNYGNFGTQLDSHPDQALVNNNAAIMRHNIVDNIYVKGPYALPLGDSGPIVLNNQYPASNQTNRSEHVSGNYLVGDALGTYSQTWLSGSKLNDIWPPGYVSLNLGSTVNVQNASAVVVYDKAVSLLDSCGPRPLNRLPKIAEYVAQAKAKLDGQTTGLGSYWGETYPNRAPTTADLGTVAQNQITDPTSPGAYWSGQACPLVNRNSIAASGYTIIEEWLHARAAEVGQ